MTTAQSADRPAPMSSPDMGGGSGPSMSRMNSRSDASFATPPGSVPDGDRDLLAINGHQFDLGAAVAPLAGEPA